MVARTIHLIGREKDPDKWRLPQAQTTNVGGQIASIAAGGAILTYALILIIIRQGNLLTLDDENI